MKITIEGFLVWKKETWQTEGKFQLVQCDMSEYGYITVQPQVVEIDIPDNWNPVPGQLDALKKEEKELRAKFARDMTTIQERRSKLLAITNEVSA